MGFGTHSPRQFETPTLLRQIRRRATLVFFYHRSSLSHFSTVSLVHAWCASCGTQRGHFALCQNHFYCMKSHFPNWSALVFSPLAPYYFSSLSTSTKMTPALQSHYKFGHLTGKVSAQNGMTPVSFHSATWSYAVIFQTGTGYNCPNYWAVLKTHFSSKLKHQHYIKCVYRSLACFHALLK